MLEQIAQLNHAILDYEREIHRMAREQYPETEVLEQVHGVGPLTALVQAAHCILGRFGHDRGLRRWGLMIATRGGARHGGYEYLWWVDYGGVHFPEVSLPGIYSARGNGLITFSLFQPWTWSSCIARTTILRSGIPRPLRKLRTERRQPV